MMAGKLQIGDVVPVVAGKAAVFTPGKSRWHALWVIPQREDQVEAWLHQRGVYSFHPVQARKFVRHGKARLYHRRYLPGYVFARFKGDPLVHRVMACPWVMGALCRSNGEWGVLEPGSMRSIHSMRKIDADQRVLEAARRARRIADAALRNGDRVMFKSGPLAGFEAEVVTLIADGGAKVSFQLFGRETLFDTSPDDLVKLLKAD